MKSKASGLTLQERLLAELREIAEAYSVPEGAMTFKQIADAMPDFPRKKLRGLLTQKIKDGTWLSVRRGNTVYYWPRSAVNGGNKAL